MRIPLRFNFSTCPALGLAFWLGLGCLAVTLPGLGLLSWCVGTSLFLLTALVFGLLADDATRRQVWALALGAGLAALHLWAPWQSYRRHLPRPECGAEIEAVVVDAAIMDDALPWLTPPRSLAVRLQRLRLAPASPWQPVQGTVLLTVKPPDGTTAPPVWRYGTVLRATGGFVRPESGLFPGDFDYRRYLLSSGVQHLFRASVVSEVRPVSGWRRGPAAVYELRERMVTVLVRNLEGDAHAQLLAAIVLGARQTFDPATRASFLRSGTIHVFSVSGLHVVILASLLVLLLRLAQVPFRWRYLGLPLILGFYVFMTGNSAPAVRAWVMISVWALARGRFVPASPINSIAVAAVLLMAWAPLSLMQTGFQFSFLMVFFLVVGWHATSGVLAAASEKERWIPLRCRSYGVGRWLWRLTLQTLTGGVLAWFASVGMIACTNGLVIPAAIPVNVGISFAAWLVLFCGTLKVLLGWLPLVWPDLFLAALIDQWLSIMTALADVGSQPGACLNIARPPVPLVVLYYLLLLFALLHERFVVCQPLSAAKRVPGFPPRFSWCVALQAWVIGHGRVLLGAGAMACVGLMFWRWSPAPAAAVFAGHGSRVPGIVLDVGRGRPPVVLNTGGPELARHLGNWLTVHGYGNLEALVLTGTGRDYAGGSLGLIQAVPARTVAAVPGRGRELAEIAAGQGGYQALRYWRVGQGPLAFAGLCLDGLPETPAGETVVSLNPEPGTGMGVSLRVSALRRTLVVLGAADGATSALSFPIAREPVLVEIPAAP